METIHEYFNLLSGLLDIAIAGVVIMTSRKLAGSTPRVIWVLAGFFLVSGLGYLNEPSPVFGTHPTIAVILDVARIVALVMMLLTVPSIIRGVMSSLSMAKFQADDRRQAMLDRFYDA